MGILFAILAACFAALVVVLTKAGLKDLDSTLAFAIQAVLILVITWVVVLVQGSHTQLAGQSKRTWLFMIAAGICTTLSTIFSYRALKLADATLVVPIETTVTGGCGCAIGYFSERKNELAGHCWRGADDCRGYSYKCDQEVSAGGIGIR